MCLLRSKLSSLELRLEKLWKGFIEKTGQTINDYLGIPHLVHLLNELNSESCHIINHFLMKSYFHATRLTNFAFWL